MATPVPSELKAGDTLSAAWLNQLVKFVAESRVTIGRDSGLIGTQSATGLAIGVQRTRDLWVRLTYLESTGSIPSAASWIEQIAATGGGWTDGVRLGYAASDPARGSHQVDPVYSSNHPLAAGDLVVGAVVDASRDEAVGRLTTRLRSCS